VAERQLPKLNVAGSIPVSRSNELAIQRKAALVSAAFLPWNPKIYLLAVCVFCCEGRVWFSSARASGMYVSALAI
jgi:hypothetical protein